MQLSIPHGGNLIDRWNPDQDLDSIDKEVELDAIALSDLELIATGVQSPHGVSRAGGLSDRGGQDAIGGRYGLAAADHASCPG